MKNFQKFWFYTILCMISYCFICAEYFNGNLWIFNLNEVSRIEKKVNIIILIIYVAGILLIIFKKENRVKEKKLLRYLNMHIPSKEEYLQIKNEVQNVFIRNWNYSNVANKFYVCDLKGNVLFKFIKVDTLIANTYEIFDPFDNKLGEIKIQIISLTPTFEINLLNGTNFQISKTLELMDQNYKITNMPFKIDGDFFGSDFSIISIENNSLQAQIDSIMADGEIHLGNCDIYLYTNQYLLEIVCCGICTILGSVALSRK